MQLANLVGFVVGADGMKLLASRMLSRESELTTTSLLKLLSCAWFPSLAFLDYVR